MTQMQANPQEHGRAGEFADGNDSSINIGGNTNNAMMSANALLQGNQGSYNTAPGYVNTFSSYPSSTANNVIAIDALRALHNQYLTRTIRALYEKGRPHVIRIVSANAKEHSNTEPASSSASVDDE
uniref:Replication-associated protein A n=1 Tax=Lygus hesperus TaxID=30085 RepID=A0A0A9WLG9_LYGHE